MIRDGITAPCLGVQLGHNRCMGTQNAHRSTTSLERSDAQHHAPSAGPPTLCLSAWPMIGNSPEPVGANPRQFPNKVQAWFCCSWRDLAARRRDCSTRRRGSQVTRQSRYVVFQQVEEYLGLGWMFQTPVEPYKVLYPDGQAMRLQNSPGPIRPSTAMAVLAPFALGCARAR